MKHAQRMSTAVILTSLVLLAPALQHSGPTDPPLDEQFPGPLAEAQFREVLAAEITGDLQLDAIVMDGQEPKLVVAPEVFDCAIGTGLSASAIAILPGVLPGKDLLLAADANGLHALERDSAQAQWIVTTLFDESSGWANAVELAVGDLDGQDGLDLVAVNAAGNQVLSAHGDGEGSFVEGSPIALGGPPTAGLRLLNWRETGDVAGTDEIALSSPAGVAIFEADGTLLVFFPGNNSGLRTAVIDDVGSSVQRLAVVGTVNGNDFLRLLGTAGATNPVSLGAAGVVAMSSGDVDGDGDTELFLSVSSERKFWMYVNQSPSLPTFVLSAPLKVAYGPANRNPAWNQAGLAVADFDSDGVIDVLAPAQGGLLPVGGGWQAVPGTLPLKHVGTTYQNQLRIGIVDARHFAETTRLLLELSPPAMQIPAQGGELRMKISVWHTPAFGQGSSGPAELTTIVDFPSSGSQFEFLGMPVDYSPLSSPDVFTFVIRQVSVLGGEVIAIGPALTALLVSEANRELIQGAPETEVFIPLQVWPDSGSPFGGIGMGPTLPPHDPDREPEEEDP